MADVFNMTDTWNNGGTTFTAIKMNVTNTASASDSKFLDIQSGGASLLALRQQTDAGGTGLRIQAETPNSQFIEITPRNASIGSVTFTGGAEYTFDNSVRIGASSSVTNLAALWCEAANILAQRGGTSAQMFRVYNTYTDSSNYERLSVGWSSNVATIGVENAGTGSARNLSIDGNADVIIDGASNVRLKRDGTQKIAFDVNFIYFENAALALSSASRTIASGAFTVNSCFEVVDTEASAATDDLDTISGGTNGTIVVLRANDSARTVVVKNGTGNLKLSGSDMSLDNADDTITLICNGTNWLEIARSSNGA